MVSAVQPTLAAGQVSAATMEGEETVQRSKVKSKAGCVIMSCRVRLSEKMVSEVTRCKTFVGTRRNPSVPSRGGRADSSRTHFLLDEWIFYLYSSSWYPNPRRSIPILLFCFFALLFSFLFRLVLFKIQFALLIIISI